MLYTSLQLKYRENCLARLHPTHAQWKVFNVAQVLRESVKQVKPVELNMHVLVLYSLQPKVASGWPVTLLHDTAFDKQTR